MSLFSRSRNINLALIISAILTLLFVTSSVTAWLFHYRLTALILACTTLVALVLFVLSLQLKRKDSLDSHERLSIRSLNRYLTMVFSKSSVRNKYSPPCFLALSQNEESPETLFESMGLEHLQYPSVTCSSVTAWRSSHCMMLHTCTGQQHSNDNEDSEWQALLRQLRLKRPRQPLSGIVIILPTSILTARDEQHEAYMDATVARCHSVITTLKQKLPVIFLISGTGQLCCIHELCQTLHRDELASPLGHIRPLTCIESTESWFNASWQKLLQKLYYRQTESLGQIYDDRSSSSSLGALFQLALLGDQVKSVLVRFATSFLNEELDIAGYFLCLTPEDTQQIDLSSLYCQYHFATGKHPDSYSVQSQQTAFTRDLVARILIPVTARTGLNKRSEFIYQLFRYTWYCFGLAMLSLSAWWLYANYALENQLNKATTSVVSRYVVESSNKTSSLYVTLSSLGALRELIDKYDDVPSLFIPSRMSHRIVKKELTQYYQQQLRLRLSPYLIDVFSTSLTVQIRNENAHGIFESLRLYQMLFDVSELNHSELHKGALALLIEHFGLDKLSSEKLALQLHDYLALPDYPTYQPDMHLIAAARGRLQGLTDAHLVYRRIKVMPEYHQNTPLEKMMGTHFNRVFAIDDAAVSDCQKGHFALFTARGWKADLSPDSPLIMNSLLDIRKLQGKYKPVSSKTAVTISDAVRQRFTKEYISRWNGVLSCIYIKPVNSIDDLEETISYLAQWGKSPMNDILETVKANTWFPSDMMQADNTEESSGEPLDLLATDRVKGAIFNEDDILTEAFADYHRLLDEKQGIVFAQSFQQLLEEIYHNLHVMRASGNQPELAFLQIRQFVAGAHPVKSLGFLALSQPNAVRRWIEEVISEWARFHMQLAGEYIQSQWLEEIIPLWRQYLDNRFPVASQAGNHIDPDDFQDFFGPKGQLQAFHDTYIKPFISKNRPARLIAQQSIHFTPAVLELFNRVTTIRSVCFDKQGLLNINMYVRVQSLSPESTHYVLSDGVTEILYRHGPALWQKVSWPVDDDNQTLTSAFYTAEKQLSENTYSGPWAWLRLINHSMTVAETRDNILRLRHEQEGLLVHIHLKGSSLNQSIESVLNSLKDISLPEEIVR